MADAGTLSLVALLAPAASFLVLALVFPLRQSGRPAAWLSILLAATSVVAAVLAWLALSGVEGLAHGDVSVLRWTWLPTATGPLAEVGALVDADSTIMLVLVALVALLVQFYSLGYLSDESPASLGRYYAYQSLFAFSMMGLVLAPNMVQLFVCWELVGLCSYLLIGFWYQRDSAARAAVKAFWTTKLGDVGLLIGIVLLWRQSGTFDLTTLKGMVDTGALQVAGLSVITFCIYLGAVGKSAQFPLHIWLPDAMEGPTPVSALIHAATMVTAGVYLLHRTAWLFALTPDVRAVVMWVGAFTALLAAVLACVQDDIKRVLAYSTVSQLGYMMTAIGAGFSAAGFIHLLTHGLFKALLFLGAGAVIHAVGSNDVSRMGGLARRMPQTAIVFVIGALALAGVPPLGGFVSKEEILAAVLAGGGAAPFLVLITVAFLTSFYMFRVVILAFFGGAHEPGAHHAHDAPATMGLPLWILAVLSTATGVALMLSGPGLLVGHVEAELATPGWLMPAAVGVAAAGIALAWLTYQRRSIDAATLAAAFGPIRRAAVARFWIDDAFVGAYRLAVIGFSRIVGWIDRYVVDGVLNLFSAWTVTAGDELRTIQTGRVQDYVYALGVGLLALLLWVNWAFA
jgi:NADH-quinone oxidoreductase subunit L